jgi:hypothetical protein
LQYTYWQNLILVIIMATKHIVFVCY